MGWAERVTVRRLEEDVERALLLRAGHPLAWARCQFDPERTQDPISPGKRQTCAPDIDVEATQRLAGRVPFDVAALLTAVRETRRSRLGAERSRSLTDGEAFDGMLDCALVAWTLRDPRCAGARPAAWCSSSALARVPLRSPVTLPATSPFPRPSFAWRHLPGELPELPAPCGRRAGSWASRPSG